MHLKHLTRPLTIKSVSEDGTFEGYGSVFNVIDSYRDIVMPGAFTRSLQEHKDNGSQPALLWQHRSDEPIGVWDSVAEDDHGLLMRGRLALDTQRGKEAYALLKMGAVKGLSIGFSVPKDGEEYNEEHGVWHLNDVDLWETSVVTFPANQAAQVTDVRADDIDIGSKRDFEKLLRDVGLSTLQAKRLMSGGYDALIRKRDADEASDLEATKALIQTIRGSQP